MQRRWRLCWDAAPCDLELILQTPIHTNYCNSNSSTDLKKLPINSEQTFVSEVLQNQHVVGQVQNRNLEPDSYAVVHSASRETEIINNTAMCLTFELFVHASVDAEAFPKSVVIRI